MHFQLILLFIDDRFSFLTSYWYCNKKCWDAKRTCELRACDQTQRTFFYQVFTLFSPQGYLHFYIYFLGTVSILWQQRVLLAPKVKVCIILFSVIIVFEKPTASNYKTINSTTIFFKENCIITDLFIACTRKVKAILTISTELFSQLHHWLTLVSFKTLVFSNERFSLSKNLVYTEWYSCIQMVTDVGGNNVFKL